MDIVQTIKRTPAGAVLTSTAGKPMMNAINHAWVEGDVRKLLLRFALGCGLAVLSGSAFAAVDLASSELIKVDGKVEVKKGADAPFKAVPENLKLAGALKRLDAADRVKTHENSGAEMVLKDTCVMEVKENSLFEVPAVLGQAALQKMRAQQGSFLFKVVTGSNFQVQTADVVAGVKGTLFEVEVVDGLHSLLALPGVAVGIENVGGSMVNVYDGEVELTHATTRKTRRLKAGESQSVLNGLLRRLDGSLADGFGPLQKFDRVRQLQERFGEVGTRLAALPSTRLGIAGFAGEGLRMPLAIGQPAERVNELVRGFSGPIVDRVRQVRERAGPVAELLGALNDVKSTPFQPTFDSGKYPIKPLEGTIGEGEIQEASLGNGLFVAASPLPGTGPLAVQSQQDAQGVGTGDGCFRLRDFLRDLDAMVSVQTKGNKQLTSIQVKRGTFYVRMQDEIDLIAIAAGRPAAFEYDTANERGRRLAVAAMPAHPGLAAYQFKVEADIAAQRAAHDKRETQKKVGVAEKVLDKVGGKKLRIPKLW